MSLPVSYLVDVEDWVPSWLSLKCEGRGSLLLLRRGEIFSSLGDLPHCHSVMTSLFLGSGENPDSSVNL